MPTRLYLPQTGAAAVSPAFDASWNDTATVPADRIAMVSTKISSTLTDRSQGFDTSFSSTKVLFRQYVSAPIGVVDFTSTTFSMVLRTIKGASQITPTLNMSLRLYHANATFDTLKALATYDTAFGTSAATRIINATSLASISSQNNDRIVLEIGAIITVSTDGSGRTAAERFGDSNASDFALTSGLTTDLNPWAEFSATIPAPAAGGVNSGFFSFM